MPNVKLKPRFKKAWLEALRSGKYRQTDGTLVAHERNKRSRYCCLGVLCSLPIVQKEFDVVKVIPTRKYNGYAVEYAGFIIAGNSEYVFEGDDNDVKCINPETEMVPNSLLKPLGLDAGQMGELAEMNDNGATFRTIANYIDENL